MPFTCKVHITARGNLFIRDIAELVTNVLNDVGVPTSIEVDQVPQGSSGTVDVIVGPHEYFIVDSDLPLEKRLEIAAASVLVTTEQPGSPFWELQRQLCEVAPLTLDISPVAVAAFADIGIAAVRLPLGYHPSLDVWGGPGAGGAERDIDVAFLGGASGHRLEALGPCAPVLAHREARLLFHDPLVPVTRAGPGYLSGTDKAEFLRRSRILLNVHNEGRSYFEWVRAIEAICNGTLLLTEPSVGFEPLEPFVHFVESDASLFGAHIAALLADEPTRSSIAEAAYDLVRTELRMTELVRGDILDALEAQAATETVVTVSPAELARTSPTPTDSGVVLLDPPADELHSALATLKRSLVEQRRLERRLERTLAEIEGVDPEATAELATPAWDSATGNIDVSVIVPLYNYEGTLAEALDSVFASRGVTPEAVVIDDHSTDRSAEALTTYLDQHPDRPILALFRRTNAGPSAARNLGVQRARTDQLFLLDADNSIVPDGLRRLVRALDESDAALAYGILEVFGDRSSLVSAMPWSVESLVRRPYIDTMCLIQRSTWDKQGGFPDDEMGLEDYAFFLALAAAGETAAWVPEIVGRYRGHASSRGSIASLDMITPTNRLRQRHPELPWPAA